MIRPRLALVALVLAALASAGHAQDYSARDKVAPLMTAGLLDRKPSVSPEMFTRYWRDVHGPLAARINGFENYWQHHLGAPLTDYWPVAVDQAVPEPLQIEGFAETTFRSAGDRAKLGADPAAQALFGDEQNAFQATYLCPSDTGDSRTLVDRLADPAPEGAVTVEKVIVLLRPKAGASQNDVRAYVGERLGPAIAAAVGTLKLRLHLLMPYDPSGWNTPNVRHALAPGEQYAAILEIAFKDAATRKRVLASAAVKGVLRDAPRFVGAFHTYPEVATYTMVSAGRPTLVGLKGLSVAETILATRAANQASPPVLRLLNGFDSAPAALPSMGGDKP